jgi:hypothetical protein
MNTIRYRFMSSPSILLLLIPKGLDYLKIPNVIAIATGIVIVIVTAIVIVLLTAEVVEIAHHY